MGNELQDGLWSMAQHRKLRNVQEPWWEPGHGPDSMARHSGQSLSLTLWPCSPLHHYFRLSEPMGEGGDHVVYMTRHPTTTGKLLCVPIPNSLRRKCAWSDEHSWCPRETETISPNMNWKAGTTPGQRQDGLQRRRGKGQRCLPNPFLLFTKRQKGNWQ